MRALLCFLCIVTHVWTVNANVEKTIFLGPRPVTFSNDRPSLEELRLATLSPTQKPFLGTKLAVQFPTTETPRGLESWYILQNLHDGRRYEARICWPATQPTDFWLNTFSIAEVLNAPGLISSLATYSEKHQQLGLEDAGHLELGSLSPAQSLLFLRVQAAASYYSLNRTLMEHPPAVDVDIILDPYILSLLPRSLIPNAAYISVVAAGAWFLSNFIYKFLLSIAAERISKPHTD